jgi:hypothetical protein
MDRHHADLEEAAIDDVLSRWHHWACDDRTAAGYPTSSTIGRGYLVSRQWDWSQGVEDGDVELVVMQAVDAIIDRIPEPFRNALHLNARNIVCGVAVWRSPRLPDDDVERAHIVAEARAQLLAALRVAELL